MKPRDHHLLATGAARTEEVGVTSMVTADSADHETGLRPLLVSVAQTLNLLGIGRTSLYELMASGEVVPVRIGRSVRFVLKDLEAFVERLRAAR